MSQAPAAAKTLRKLYLTLFLRGRASRGLNKDRAPKSVGRKMAASLIIYTLIGFTALIQMNQGTFFLSLHLHSMTLLFLALFVSGSAGEVLFNAQEAEILLHRPVTAQQLLQAKIRVMVEVCLWLAFAFNLVGLAIGSFGTHGHLLFLPAHITTTAMAALLCTASIVLIYQLCLRWFGRDKLENLMTATQMLLVIAVVLGSQLAPRLISQWGHTPGLDDTPWWLMLLPPAWFAGLDELLIGHVTPHSLILGFTATVATIIVPWLAITRLSSTYQEGLQTLAESSPTKTTSSGRHQRIDRLMRFPPLAWWLRDPQCAVGFRLTAAYLFRDRDTKLRFYPGLAPILVMPLVFLLPSAGGMDRSFGIALAGGYLATLPLLALNILQFSQNWQASDLFRYSPMPGPGPLIHGARIAVMVLIALPALAILAIVSLLLTSSFVNLPLLLPGIIALPVYAHLAGATGRAIPLSKPCEEARSAGRGISVMLLMFSSFFVSGLAIVSWKIGFFPYYLILEVITAAALCYLLGKRTDATPWPRSE